MEGGSCDLCTFVTDVDASTPLSLVEFIYHALASALVIWPLIGEILRCTALKNTSTPAAAPPLSGVTCSVTPL